MAWRRNLSSSISPSLSICKLFEAKTTSLPLYEYPPKQSRSAFFSVLGGYFGFNFLLVLVLSVVCMDLVSPLVNGYFGRLFRGFSSSFFIFCCVSSVENKVICRVQFLHSKNLRRVFCSPSREAGCGVISDSYLRWVFSSPTRVTDCLNLVSVPVLLMSWFVCDLMKVCCKYGDDLFQKIYYHKSVLQFSGRWKSSDGFPGELAVCTPWNMWTRFGFWHLSSVEEGFIFIGSIRKNSYRVVDQSSSIQAHPYVRGMSPLLLLFDDRVIDMGFWLQEILVTSDSGYLWILVTCGNHSVLCFVFVLVL